MANPSPQHTPTDGLGTPAKCLVTSSDANFTTVVANREYTQPLSLTGATYNGVTYGSTATLTGTVKDIAGSAFTSGNSNTVQWKSYDTSIATVVLATGVVTPVKAGQVTIEVQFDTFDGGNTNSTLGNDKIYAQVLVQVYP